MSGQPWFKFFPADWRSDTALRMCSPSARCLWIEMLCIMHDAEPRGHLTVQGRSLDARTLGIQAGMTPDEVRSDLAELEANGVFSRKADGTIFSRKMVRETRQSAEQSARAKKRWSLDDVEESDAGVSETMPQSLEARVQKEEKSPDGDSGEILPFGTLAPVSDPVLIAFDAYNSLAGMIGLSKAMKLTTQRRASLKKRLSEHGQDGWQRALQAVSSSEFLRGSTGWRADLDFLLQPSSLQKVLEGKYERSNNGKPRTSPALERHLGELGAMARGIEAVANRGGRREFGG